MTTIWERQQIKEQEQARELLLELQLEEIMLEKLEVEWEAARADAMYDAEVERRMME